MGDPVETQAPVITIDGDLFKDSSILDAARAKLHADLAALPPDQHVGVIVGADTTGTATAKIVTRFNNHWSFDTGGSYSLKTKRPAGYLALEASF